LILGTSSVYKMGKIALSRFECKFLSFWLAFCSILEYVASSHCQWLI